MSTINTGFEDVMKNFMLEQWKDQTTFTLRARDGIVNAGPATTVTFGNVSNGSVSVSGTPVIDIFDDENFTVTNIQVQLNGTSQIQWTIPVGDRPTFTNGGTITIDGLSVSID